MPGDERVYVGSKHILAYVTALVNLSKSDNVTVMTWGRAISTVDAIELTQRSLLTDLVVEGIDVGTERLWETGAERNVSTISIQMTKPTEKGESVAARTTP